MTESTNQSATAGANATAIAISIEGLGEKFNREKYFEARRICMDVVDQIAGRVEAGMTEADGQALVKAVFAKHGVTKFWHATKFRIGADTVKNFRELPDPSQVITPGDFYFIDVGPVILDHEADFGRTYQFGAQQLKSSPQAPILAASTDLWHQVAAKWKSDRLTGPGLYEYASREAEKLGYRLNLAMDGHRLGDFPHAIHSKKGLTEIDFIPAPDLWVLEIHLLTQDGSRGAFYEDILSG